MADTTPATTLEEFTLPPVRALGPFGDYLLTRLALINFQAHVINVMMDHSLKKAMNKLEAARRLIQWAVELSEFDIKYQLRYAIKAQAL